MQHHLRLNSPFPFPFLPSETTAKLLVPAFRSDYMVFQQNTTTELTGWRKTTGTGNDNNGLHSTTKKNLLLLFMVFALLTPKEANEPKNMAFFPRAGQNYRNKLLFFVLLLLVTIQPFNSLADHKDNSYAPNHPFFQYTGRIDFSDSCRPRFWAPGVYIEAWFKGDHCQISLNDEVPWANTHNYVSVKLDEEPVQRLKLTKKVNTLNFWGNPSKKRHKITICKSTESGIGYLEFAGMQCQKLLAPPQKPRHKIEFYGNSITCGTGSDTSVIPCNSGEWYDQHNAYMSYGPRAARSLDAQWMLSSVSGIGLVHSCCNMTITMPDVYDRLNQRDNKYQWNFSNYQPDVVCIALGQNDGIQDSTLFCSRYIGFLHTLRAQYPKSTFICLTSPMGDEQLTAVLKNYLRSIVVNMNASGDKDVCSFFFSRSYNKGCGGHPDLEQHGEIAKELSQFIKKLKGW